MTARGIPRDTKFFGNAIDFRKDLHIGKRVPDIVENRPHIRMRCEQIVDIEYEITVLCEFSAEKGSGLFKSAHESPAMHIEHETARFHALIGNDVSFHLFLAHAGIDDLTDLHLLIDGGVGEDLDEELSRIELEFVYHTSPFSFVR